MIIGIVSSIRMVTIPVADIYTGVRRLCANLFPPFGTHLENGSFRERAPSRKDEQITARARRYPVVAASRVQIFAPEQVSRIRRIRADYARLCGHNPRDK